MPARALPAVLGAARTGSDPRGRVLIMRLNQLKTAVAAVGTAALIVGCAVAPVSNVVNQPVLTNRPVSLDDVGNAIVRAGTSLNMQMLKVGPGLITATYTPRGPSATMEIKYDTKEYSITYKDSQGMRYDGSQVHKKYNIWVHNLDNRIRAQLSAL